MKEATVAKKPAPVARASQEPDLFSLPVRPFHTVAMPPSSGAPDLETLRRNAEHFGHRLEAGPRVVDQKVKQSPEALQSSQFHEVIDPSSDMLPRPIQRQENETGMPDRLKAGLEQLSGIDLSTVRVHYNAFEPARFGAHAYTQGKDIYVAPGQEKHLPHEGWHAVQQMQGRVRPTMQLDRVPLNDDAGLEREADIMGAKAVGDLKASRQPSERAQITTSPSASSPLQRKPKDVIHFLRPGPTTRNYPPLEEYGIFERARLNSLVPLDELVKTTQYYKLVAAICNAIRARLNRSTTNLKKFATDIVRKWNAGLERGLQIESVDVLNMLNMYPDPKPKPKDLEEWYRKSVAKKRMTAPIKQIELLEFLQRSKRSLNEDEDLVVKLMFRRTAGFRPLNNQGKSLHSKKVYFRSTATDIAKAMLAEEVKADDKESWKSYTINIFNREMHSVLGEKEIIDPGKLEIMEEEKEYSAAIAAYKSWFYKIASLGLPANIYNAVRTRIQRNRKQAIDSSMDIEDNKSEDTSHQSNLARHKKLLDLTSPAWSMPEHDQNLNYHDYIIKYSGETVQAIGELVKKNFTGIHAVQSPGHPSLILELENKNVFEKEWRERFIDAFNKSAAAKRSELRITERNSFGFIHPSVSSVGGPVRIWPGLAPHEILKTIVIEALNALAGKHGLQIGKTMIADRPPQKLSLAGKPALQIGKTIIAGRTSKKRRATALPESTDGEYADPRRSAENRRSFCTQHLEKRCATRCASIPLRMVDRTPGEERRKSALSIKPQKHGNKHRASLPQISRCHGKSHGVQQYAIGGNKEL